MLLRGTSSPRLAFRTMRLCSFTYLGVEDGQFVGMATGAAAYCVRVRRVTKAAADSLALKASTGKEVDQEGLADKDWHERKREKLMSTRRCQNRDSCCPVPEHVQQQLAAGLLGPAPPPPPPSPTLPNPHPPCLGEEEGARAIPAAVEAVGDALPPRLARQLCAFHGVGRGVVAEQQPAGARAQAGSHACQRRWHQRRRHSAERVDLLGGAGGGEGR